MERKLVVSFHLIDAGAGRRFLERARALDARASAYGGVLVAWDAARVSYAFDAASLAEILDLVAKRGDDTSPEERPWSVGLSEGEIESLDEKGGTRDLGWGRPLVVAALLSQVARPGELLCDEELAALTSRELLGTKARSAEGMGVAVRGARVDPKRPWRKGVVAELARMQTAPFVSSRPDVAGLRPGALQVVRAAAGGGGSRCLEELTRSAGRVLPLGPMGTGFEPLGCLRRALARSMTRDLGPALVRLAEPLERLLAGDGVSLDVAASLIHAYFQPRMDRAAVGALVLDDALAIDFSTLEACARAIRVPGAAFGVIVRLDEASALPSPLTDIEAPVAITIAPLSPAEARSVVAGACGGALSEAGQRRWARLGGSSPLGLVSAVAWGIATGEIEWRGETAVPRSPASGRGSPRTPADWIRLRAEATPPHARFLLGVIALLGGHAKISRVEEIVRTAGEALSVRALAEELVGEGWLVDANEDWVMFPSRTHRDVLAAMVPAERRPSIHLAACAVLAAKREKMGLAEAAWHAARAGEKGRAAELGLAAARDAASLRLQSSVTQLANFVSSVEPEFDPETLASLRAAAERPRTDPPRVVPTEAEDDDLDRLTIPDVPHFAVEPASPALASAPPERADAPTPAGDEMARALGELATDALRGGDREALERWIRELDGSAEGSPLAERMRALSQLGRGDVGHALRVLKNSRRSLDPSDHTLRCQTSLALGVALSFAGRPDEALLAGMEALARAREARDAHGARACLAFLAKLYSSVDRKDEAESLRAASLEQ